MILTEQKGNATMVRAGFRRRPLWIALGCAVAGALASCAASPPQSEGLPGTSGIPRTDEQCPAENVLLSAESSRYGRILVKQIGKSAIYPSAALSLDQSGVVQVCIEMSRSGDVQKALVKTSSGYLILDGAALFAVGLANAGHRIDAVPATLGDGAANVWFTVPVSFRIDEEAASPAPAHEAAEPNLNCARGPGEEGNRQLHITPEAQRFYDGLQRAVEQQVLFPRDAAAQRESGSAGVCLLLARDGRIVNGRISRSAGDPLFDGIALIAVGIVAARLDSPRIPDSLSGVPPYIKVYFPINWDIQ